MNAFRRIAFCILTALVAPVEASEVIGNIIFAQGKAFLQREGTRLRVPVSAGDLCHSGDVYQTAVGGHLRIKLRSGHLLILRQESRFMLVEASETSTRLRLDAGVLRSISARARQDAAPVKIVTPLALLEASDADLTLHADEENLRATAARGNVRLLPADSQCGEPSAGNCENAVELPQGRPVMLVLDKGETRARLVPAAKGDPDGHRPPLEDEPCDASGNSACPAPIMPGSGKTP